MSESTAVTQNGDVVARDKLASFLNSAAGRIANILPRHLTPERLARVAHTAISKDAKLMQCTPESIAMALLEAGQLGLEPNGVLGHAYLVAYWNKKANGGKGAYEAQFMPGYRGLIDLACRSTRIAKVEARCVHERDDFEFWYGLEQRLRHRPATSDSGPLTHAYAIAYWRDGTDPIFEVLDREQIERQHRSRSKAKDDGPWVTDYDAMCRKTAVRVLAKFLPLSPEAMAAFELDGAREAGRPVRITADGILTEDVPEPPAQISRTEGLMQKLSAGAAVESSDDDVEKLQASLPVA